MKQLSLLSLATTLMIISTASVSAPVTESIELEGMVTPASPRALSQALESKLAVKVSSFEFYGTQNGWPTITVEYDSDTVTREQIDSVINSTEDPTGTPFKVHKDEVQIHMSLSEEETAAARQFAEGADIAQVSNPVPPSAESHERGQALYVQYCSKCHGMTGNGRGPSAHGFTTYPRQLWTWYNADAAADPYLFWFITNGRTDMPPWGVILSEEQRWDLVNYIKTIAPPAQ